MRINLHERGLLYIITGPMFSGKTGKFLEAIDFVRYSRIPWQIFKPESDDRPELYEGTNMNRTFVLSRGIGGKSTGLPATVLPNDDVENLPNLLHLDVLRQKGYIGIDEVTLMNGRTLELVQELLNYGCSIITAGLDMDFRGMPFGSMPQLLALATHSEKRVGVCMYENGGSLACENDGTHSIKYVNEKPAHWNAPIKEVGTQQYAVVCKAHHIVPGRPSVFNFERRLEK